MVHRSLDEPSQSARAWLQAACCTLIVAALPGQDPTGLVLDASGAPIAGARVRVERQEHVAHEFAAALRATLQRRPVPQVYSTKDGSFVLPLLPDHRRLGTGYDPPLVLLIEAEGFQTWREPLPFGLAGFAGTRAVLHRFDAADAYDIQVVDPAPGALLWVRRLGDVTIPEDVQYLDVPADGRLRVYAPLLPSPLVWPDWRCTRELGHDVQVLTPGRSSARVRLHHDQRTVEIAAARHERAALPIRDHHDRPVPGAQGLYHLPDESLRWFPVPDSIAAQDDWLTLIAVGAPGAVTVVVGADTRSVRLPPSPETPTLALRVHDSNGARPDAEAWLVPITEARSMGRTGPRGRSQARAVPVDARGVVTIPTEAASEQALVVEAPGCAPRTWMPDDLIRPDLTLDLAHAGTATATVRVLAPHSRPAVGADVRLPESAFLPGARPRVFRTDQDGMCRVPGLRPGTIEILAVGDGALARTHVSLRADDHGVVTLTLAGHHLRGVARDARGQRVAFRAFSIEASPELAARVTRSHTDSLGRIELPFAVGEPAITFMTGGVATQVLHEGRVEDLLVDPAKCAVVRLPAEAVVLRAEFTGANGANAEHLRVPASSLLVAAPENVTRIDLILAAGPPVILLDSELGPAHEPILLDRHRIIRRVPLRFTDPTGNAVTGTSVVNLVGGTRPSVFDSSEEGPVEEVGGELVWCARDRAEHRLAVFHPDFLPTVLQVPEASAPGADEPLHVVLTRGAPVSVAMHRLDVKGALTVMRVTQGDQLVLMARVKVPLPVAEDPTVFAVLPCALAPGSYTVHVEQQMEVRQLPIIVVGTEPHRLR